MFGAIRAETGTSDNTRKFTGKEFDADSNLYYYAARYYDPYIGRFTQRDPIGDGVNWYVYTYNNPLKYTDPTGQLAKVRDLSGSPVEFMHSVFWDPDIEHFAFNDGSSVTWHSPDKLASLLLDFTPIIGDAKGFIEGVIGKDLVTGQSLTPVDRFLGLVLLTEVRGAKKGIDLFDAAFDAAKHASTPVGRKGKEIQVPRSNKPAKIAGRDYSGHALDRMQERGLTPSTVENTIKHGSVKPGNRPGTTAHYDSRNNVTVITNSKTGTVVTTHFGKP